MNLFISTASLALGIFSTLSLVWIFYDRQRCPTYHPTPRLAYWASLLLSLSWAVFYATS